MHTRPSRFGIYPFHPLARINFSCEKKFFSREKVGRKISSNAGVSVHLPRQGGRGMGSPPHIRAVLLHLSNPPNSRGHLCSKSHMPILDRPEGCFGWGEVQNSWATSHREKIYSAFNSNSFERVQKIAKLLKTFTFKAWSGQGTIAPNRSRAERRSFELQGDVIVVITHEGHLAAKSSRT